MKNGPICMLPEIYDPAVNKWFAFSKETSKLPMYAHLFLLSTGQIFYSGVQFRTPEAGAPKLLTLPTDFTQPITEKPVAGMQEQIFGDQAASVLLPVAQEQRVIVIGGGSARKTFNGKPNPTYQTTTTRVNIVDLNFANPSYKPAANLNYARMHHNAVLLPDRTVFVCNGSTRSEKIEESLLPAEIYDPVNNTWTAVATPTVSDRVYHSGALLLPNATVLTFGGNHKRSYYQSKLEVYSPPYLFKGPQPVIKQAPQEVTYSQTFVIETPQFEDIKWVSLIKPMATTHSTDTEQRLIGVNIKSKADNSLKVRLTGVKNVAPPGWYMLFITNYLGVPSVAKWIQLN